MSPNPLGSSRWVLARASNEFPGIPTGSTAPRQTLDRVVEPCGVGSTGRHLAAPSRARPSGGPIGRIPSGRWPSQEAGRPLHRVQTGMGSGSHGAGTRPAKPSRSSDSRSSEAGRVRSVCDSTTMGGIPARQGERGIPGVRRPARAPRDATRGRRPQSTLARGRPRRLPVQVRSRMLQRRSERSAERRGRR